MLSMDAMTLYLTAVSLTVAAVTLYLYWNPPAFVFVRRIKKPGRGLNEAIDYAVDNFPENQINDADDFSKWFSQAEEARKEHGVAPIEEYLLVGKYRGGICAILNATSYKDRGLVFASYLYVDKRIDAVRSDRVGSRRLMSKFMRVLRSDKHHWREAILEVESPLTATEHQQRNERIAKISTLISLASDFGVRLQVLGAAYIQPRLNLKDPRACEEPMCLLYAASGDATASCLPRADAARLFDFIYNELYGDCFEDSEEDDARYREYVGELCEKTTESLSESTPMFSKYTSDCELVLRSAYATIPERKDMIPIVPAAPLRPLMGRADQQTSSRSA